MRVMCAPCCAQGDHGDTFYVITSGGCEVRRREREHAPERVIGELAEGACNARRHLNPGRRPPCERAEKRRSVTPSHLLSSLTSHCMDMPV